MDKRRASEAAVGAAVAGGALAVAKAEWDRRSGRQARRFRLRDGESVPDGIARIAGAQLDMAIERLAGETGEDKGSAVHEARKSLKRLRATVRLAREALGGTIYRRENRAFRDAGRRLAGARDSQVLLETLDALGERYTDELRAESYGAFRETLVGQCVAAKARLDEGRAETEVLGDLREARARLDDWPLADERVDALAPGFERIYRRGRRAHQKARKNPDSENLHELRKRAKDLWYSAQILRPASPKRMKRVARRAHDLSDQIGEEHDLALLAERARERDADFDDEATLEDLLALIKRRRKNLRGEASSAAKRLYRRKPSKFVGRLLSETTSSSQ
jgi:CHAD domain-containing protein